MRSKAAAAICGALLLAACASTDPFGSVTPPETAATTIHEVDAGAPSRAADEPARSSETTRLMASFGAGNPVEVFAPAEKGPWPVVLLVHGGGWFSGDPASMVDLADHLAANGIVVFNVGYRTGENGGSMDDMIEDIACGAAFARAESPAYSTDPSTLIGMGHSAGAHLVMSAALTGVECPSGGVERIDEVIGLAGPYDVTRIPILSPLFGGSAEEAPEAWRRADPLEAVGTATVDRVVLVHGDQDNIVPLEFSEQMHAALVDAGVASSLEVIGGARHGDVIDPAIVGEVVLEAMQG